MRSKSLINYRHVWKLENTRVRIISAEASMCDRPKAECGIVNSIKLL